MHRVIIDNVKVLIAKPYGYCAGVANAINLAHKTKQANPNRKIVILGMLIHNDDALKDLEKMGIETIYQKDCDLLDLIDVIRDNSIVILTAHGHKKEVESKLKERGLEYVDTTCLFVNLTFSEIAKSVKDNHDVIYIGKNHHPEANAALAISSHVHLLDVSNPVVPDIKDESPLIINQTTFSHFEIERLIGLIKAKYPHARVFKSVCDASTKRQQALLDLPKDVELIYVVGGKNSNNAKTLFDLASKHFPTAKVLAIQNENDVKEKDLDGLNLVAISSGASTPKEISEAIKAKIESLCN